MAAGVVVLIGLLFFLLNGNSGSNESLPETTDGDFVPPPIPDDVGGAAGDPNAEPPLEFIEHQGTGS